MTITSIVVVFATSWFLALLVALPIGIRTQGEAGEITPGTPGSAPADPMIRKKVIWATKRTTSAAAAKTGRASDGTKPCGLTRRQTA